jgi:peptidyl-prolyl cis-trans isomerase SurA
MKQTIKKVLLISALALSAQGAEKSQTTGHSAGIAAVVNHRLISVSDLKYRLRLAMLSSGMPENAKAFEDMKSQILNMMIEEEVQKAIGDQLNINIDLQSIMHAIANIEQQNNMPEGSFKKMLSENGIPMRVMENQIRATLTWQEYIRARYRDAVQINESDVDQALADQEAKSKTTRFELFEILVHTNPNTSAEQARALASKIRAQLEKGAPFTALAQQFSNAPSASHGGQLGWMSEHNLEPNVLQHLKSTPVGQVTEPILTDRGYYLFLVRDRLNPGDSPKPKTFYTFKQIAVRFPQDAFQFELKEHIANAKAFARSIKSCRLLDQQVKGRRNILVQNAQRVPAEVLTKDMHRILDPLAVDQASDALITQEGAVIFVMCAKDEINPHKMEREEIRDQLMDSKLRAIADREMRNRRLSAHIDIRLNRNNHE